MRLPIAAVVIVAIAVIAFTFDHELYCRLGSSSQADLSRTAITSTVPLFRLTPIPQLTNARLSWGTKGLVVSACYDHHVGLIGSSWSFKSIATVLACCCYYCCSMFVHVEWQLLPVAVNKIASLSRLPSLLRNIKLTRPTIADFRILDDGWNRCRARTACGSLHLPIYCRSDCLYARLCVWASVAGVVVGV